MAKDNSVWRGNWGRISITALIATAVALVIWKKGDAFGLTSNGLKLLVFVAVIILLLLVRHGKTISLAIKQQWSRFQAKHKNVLPADEGRVEQIAPRSVTVDTIRAAMRNLYGRRWGCKMRILLVTGTVAEVEQLTPGLTAQLWQEDRGTLLLWGGDLNTPADSAWLTALRKLRRRPADGLVWVTSAFDQLSAPGMEQPLPVPSESTMDTLAHALSDRMDVLGWKLPLYVWSLHPRAGKPEGRITQATGCLLPARCRADGLVQQLQALSPGLVAQGVQQVCHSAKHNFLLMLAGQLRHEPQSLVAPLSVMLNPYRPLPLAGVVFSQMSEDGGRSVLHHWGLDRRWDVLPDSVRTLPATLSPRKLGLPFRKMMLSAVAALIILWGGWMVLSFISNRNTIQEAQEHAALAAQQKQPLAERLRALLALQKTLARLQYRAEHGVPWYEQAGLSQNNALLAALWPRYQDSALPLIRDAVAGHLRSQLEAFVQLPADSPQRARLAKTAYNQLKLWLMLTRPDKMDPAWFRDTLMQDWPTREGMAPGAWQGDGPALLAFYAAALPSHPQWRLNNDDELVSTTRGLLVRLTGMRNSESGLYQKVLKQVSHLYADMRLEDMTGETDVARLYTTKAVVPGMFTRQAWENAVQPAIEKVVKERRDEMDWVLTDSKTSASQQVSPETLKQQLTDRYFADFSGAWLSFLNSIRLQPAPTLSDVIDQLTLMADVRQSPLIALMNTLNVQGHTGETGDAITDSLVKSAKDLLSRESVPAIDQRAATHGPLDDTFGPVLALTGKQTDGNSDSRLSLQTFLTRVTQVRLHLQQVTDATDPQAMMQALAQAVFQGKSVDLTDTQNYGSLVAAELGQEWRSFGQTLFVRPMAQSWQQVLTPAAESLNAQWRASVVNDWNRAFGGRYPFKDTDSDASLTLLAKYLDADSGRVAAFMKTSLNGVLHQEGSRWVPDALNSQGLTFNPAFLDAINTLSHVSDVAFTTDTARLQFDLRPGTAAGVVETDFRTDGQTLNYVNQMPVWKHFNWPGDTTSPGASLSWISVQAGTRAYAELPGEWGLIRLLDKAEVKGYPGLNSSYRLRWDAQDGRALNYTLRTQAGEGPLVLLKLRHFTLPDTVFVVKDTHADRTTADEQTEDSD
ncbi:Uncharacterized protein conserved in bacteria [Serratia fonticola]|uniref:ImcF-related family protein n=1 Tax=Serratia fonticola TaxID=47917 RepID=UPI00217CB090|nr:ImcF-related family protein [Serratia fonticola]CAI1904184.1 Uncharacterized protein conserved in bacteria [Serratia fonticola]